MHKQKGIITYSWTRKLVSLMSVGRAPEGSLKAINIWEESYSEHFMYILSIVTLNHRKDLLYLWTSPKEGFATPIGLKHWTLGMAVLMSRTHIHLDHHLFSLHRNVLCYYVWGNFVLLFCNSDGRYKWS